MENKYFAETGEGLIEENKEQYNVKRDFVTLDAWKKARKVKLFFYESIITTLPKVELYALTSQIRRAAISTTAI